MTKAAGIQPLPSLIRASAADAAAMSMRKAGRAKWNEDDWNAMCEVQDRLIRSIYGRPSDHNQPDYCFLRFQIAEAMEKSGVFTLKSDLTKINAAIDAILA